MGSGNQAIPTPTNSYLKYGLGGFAQWLSDVQAERQDGVLSTCIEVIDNTCNHQEMVLVCHHAKKYIITKG